MAAGSTGKPVGMRIRVQPGVSPLRQAVESQREFTREFGRPAEQVWLPYDAYLKASAELGEPLKTMNSTQVVAYVPTPDFRDQILVL